MEKIEEVSYGIIPVCKKQGDWEIFLIQHKEGNHWGFPKGKTQTGESPKQTAMRELKEETNLDLVSFLSDVPLKEEYHFYRNHKEIQKKVLYYLVQVQGEPKLQIEEIRDGKWFTFAQAYSKITFGESKYIFSKVQEMIRKIHI